MKYINKITFFCLLCVQLLAVVGCTDWEEHYDEGGKRVSYNTTLWEEISSRPELAEFKSLLEEYGYKEMLDGSQMYTVFAPKGTIDTVGLSTAKIKKEVIENHIARFAHSANSATIDKDVVMLNAKEIKFTQNAGGYAFGNNMLTDDCNVGAKNGVLHVIDGQQLFFHNIWEYLTTSSEFDNVRKYLYSQNDTILDENKSVKGEINEDGQQEYLDSVINISNSLLYRIGQLNNEDSTYTMLLPTNEAWDKAYTRIKGYYQYPNNIEKKKRDSLQKVYTEFSIVRDLVFSHTVQKSIQDSLKSTTGNVFEKPFENILSDYVRKDVCSNGEVYVVDELKHNPWDSWHNEIVIEAERANALDETATTGANIFRRTLPTSDSLYAKVSGGSYVEFIPKSSIEKPTITFNVWNTLSGKYNVKVVFLPQSMASNNKGGVSRKNLFHMHRSVLNRQGELASQLLKNNAMNDPLRIDTLNIGTINLSYCAYGTEQISLKLKMESLSEKSGSDEKFSTTYLIDCIILEPSNK